MNEVTIKLERWVTIDLPDVIAEFVVYVVTDEEKGLPELLRSDQELLDEKLTQRWGVYRNIDDVSYRVKVVSKNVATRAEAETWFEEIEKEVISTFQTIMKQNIATKKEFEFLQEPQMITYKIYIGEQSF